MNVHAIKWEVLLAQMIASCALVNIHASISSRIRLETRKTLAVESSKSIRTGRLLAANKRIFRTLVDVTALDKLAAEDDGVEAGLALADEGTVGVLASCSDCRAVAIDRALVDVLAVGGVDDTLVPVYALAGEGTVVVQAVFKV